MLTRAARKREVLALAAAHNASHALLSNGDIVHMVVVKSEESLALALTCSILRNAVHATLKEAGKTMETRAGRCAAVSVERLRWALSLGCPLSARICMDAAQAGNLDVLEEAHEAGCPLDASDRHNGLLWRGIHGTIGVRRYLYDPTTTCSAAATKGHLEILQWAHARGSEDKLVCEAAAGMGHIDCLSWAHENGCPWSQRTTDMATTAASLPCLRYALERGCEYDETDILETAARNGDIETLKYLHSRFDFKWYMCAAAAYTGRLECLDFLRNALSPPCPWDERTYVFAVKSQILEPMLRIEKAGSDVAHPDLDDNGDDVCDGAIRLIGWLRSQSPPCPWDERACAAAASGAWAALVWMRGQDPPCPWDEGTSARAAAWSLEKLQWVRAQDPPCPWDETVCEAASWRGDLQTLQWAIDNGCPWDPAVCEKTALQPGECDAEFIDEHDDPLEFDEGHHEVLEWLKAYTLDSP